MDEYEELRLRLRHLGWLLLSSWGVLWLCRKLGLGEAVDAIEEEIRDLEEQLGL